MDKLQRILEAAGVEFIEENGGGPGVRLANDRKRKIEEGRRAAAFCEPSNFL